jgi:hypothetical protein
VHLLKKAKRRLETRRVGTVLGVVVSPVMQVMKHLTRSWCLSDCSGMWTILPELALNMDNPIIGRLSHQPAPLVMMRKQNR